MEQCGICCCALNRTNGEYAKPTVSGRSHATQHHYEPERFFGRSANRRGSKREGIFATTPFGLEGSAGLFCYECHEELLHNPIFLPQDIEAFARLVALRGLSEQLKEESRTKIAGRILLLHEVIDRGLREMLNDTNAS